MGRQARPRNHAPDPGAALPGCAVKNCGTITFPLEQLMNARFKGLVSLCCLWFITSTATAGEPETRPVKKSIRANDGVNLVCEVRGQGDTALIFLHGWCGDREYWK